MVRQGTEQIRMCGRMESQTYDAKAKKIMGTVEGESLARVIRIQRIPGMS